jgi:hydrogenase expression/formation protein HypC
MCLAVPARITKLNKNIAEVESLGVKKEIDVSLVPDVNIGDYVIVHAGFAIQIINEEDALISQGYWKEYLDKEKI